MKESDKKEISVDEIMRLIRTEVEKKTFIHEVGAFKKDPSEKDKKLYTISDLTNFHDEEFIRNSYRIILRREVDSEGLSFYLTKIRAGELNKRDVLCALRYSREGKDINIIIKGLYLSFLVRLFFRVPVFGYSLKIFLSIIRLPTLLQGIVRLEAHVNARLNETSIQMRHHIDILRKEIEVRLNRLEKHSQDINEKIETQGAELSNKLEAQGAEFQNKLKVHETDLKNMLEVQGVEMNNKLGVLESQFENQKVNIMNELEQYSDKTGEILQQLEEDLIGKAKENQNRHFNELREQKILILDQQRRLSVLLESLRKQAPKSLSKEQMTTVIAEEDTFLDAMYVSFEDRYRGTRHDIKKRQEVYLPYIEEIKTQVNDFNVIDLGCGRGEWLELLSENEISANGIDNNHIQIKECQNYGLNVVESDVMDFLRMQKNESIGMITGFHLVEHLPMKILVSLLDECFRVLKSGGAVIFETPNPENVLVSCQFFYLDPTHKNPVNKLTLRFILEYRGFSSFKELLLHPFPEEFLLSGSEVGKRFNEYFYGAQDYALIGYKK